MTFTIDVDGTENETPEDLKVETLPYPLVWSGDFALRLWVFDVIHSNEYVNLMPGTLQYCEDAVRWLRDGKPQATGEKVIPFTQGKPRSATFAPYPPE